MTPDHLELAASLDDVGQSHLRLRQHQLAEPLLRESLDIRRAALSAGDRLTLQTQGALGETLIELGRFDEAETMLSQALVALRAQAKPDPPRIRAAIERIVRLYSVSGKSAEAARYQAMLDQPSP